MPDYLSSVVVMFAISAMLYPSARFILPKIKSVSVHVFLHLATGIGLAVILYKLDTLYVLAMTIISYYAVRFCRPLGAIGITCVLLAISHYIIIRRAADWDLDMTMMTMLILQKVVAISQNIDDGRKRASGEKIPRLRWEQVALDAPPSLIRYMAWVFTPLGASSGPFYEYSLFELILNRGNRPDSDIPEADHKLAFFRWLWCFPHALACQLALMYITYDTVYLAEWYLNLPIIVRSFILPCITCSQAVRYFPIWWMVEAGLIELGLHANGLFPGEELSNMSMWWVCKATTVNDWFRRWNHSTHIFWKNYLFTRMVRVGYSPTLSGFCVFTSSMLWHGFRPVYVMMLPENYMMMIIDQYWNRKFPLTDESPAWEYWLHIIVIKYSMLYTTSSFFWPWVPQFFYIRGTVWFLPDFLYIFIGIVVVLLPKRKKVEKTE
jgi:hypothetical protein